MVVVICLDDDEVVVLVDYFMIRGMNCIGRRVVFLGLFVGVLVYYVLDVELCVMVGKLFCVLVNYMFSDEINKFFGWRMFRRVISFGGWL